MTIFDADTKQAIWRGFATDAISDDPKQSTKAREQAVARLFAKIPARAVTELPMRNYLSLVLLSFVLALSAVAPGGAQRATPAAADDTTGPARVEVPNIIFSASPALLVLIEGDPVYQNVDGTALQRIVNTKVLILRDEVGGHYLKILDGWMQAYSLGSWWEVTSVPPEGADIALRRAVAAKDVDLLDGGKAKAAFARLSLADGLTPAIFVSTKPAVLVATDGPARFVNVPGTSLDYVANTTRDRSSGSRPIRSSTC